MYQLSEEQRMLQETVRRIAQEQIEPGAGERDQKGEFSWEMLEVLKQNGLFAADFKEEWGGAEMGLLALGLAVEEISKVCASTAVLLLTHELGAMPMMLAGSEEQKQRWLPGLASGEKMVAFGLTEAGAGSDAGGIRTKAVRQGDNYLVTGGKQFITHADVADYICVAAVTDTQAPAHKGGLSILVVEKGTPGLSIGKKEDKMGIRASSTCEVILEDCLVPADNLLAREGDGFAILMKTLDFTRPCVAAQAVGIAQGALDVAVAYAKEREQFGRPLFANQGMQWMLADMDCQVEAARQLTYKALSLFHEVPKDLSRVPTHAVRLSAACKLFAAETAMKVTTDAVQVLGGYGYIKEYPVERMMRDAKITQIYEGTSQVQKMVLAACL